MPADLARWITADATSRTCVTPPGTPSTSAEPMVCTESTTSSDGATSSMWVSKAPRSVSAARNSSSCRAPVRSARSLTCAADSSPET
jgi:hypothetical protein